jgi:hypothetical protein
MQPTEAATAPSPTVSLEDVSMKTKSDSSRPGFKDNRTANTPNSRVMSRARDVTHEEISARAQAIWEQQGRPYGRDEEIWLEAERQLGARSSRQGELHESDQDVEDATKLENRLDDTGEPLDPRSPTSL